MKLSVKQIAYLHRAQMQRQAKSVRPEGEKFMSLRYLIHRCLKR